jgi:membrane protein
VDETTQEKNETTQEKTVAREPEGPAHPRKGGVVQTLKRTVAEFQEDNLTDWAAALTYYAVLSIFPCLLVLVSLLGLLAAFWSASGYIAAFMRASNAIYDVPEGRPIVVFTGKLAEQAGEALKVGGDLAAEEEAPGGDLLKRWYRHNRRRCCQDKSGRPGR